MFRQFRIAVFGSLALVAVLLSGIGPARAQEAPKASGTLYNAHKDTTYGRWQMVPTDANAFGYSLHVFPTPTTVLITDPYETTSGGMMYTYKKYECLPKDPENSAFWVPLTSGRLFMSRFKGRDASGHSITLINYRGAAGAAENVAQPRWQPVRLRLS
jgi:hypothetical protein